MSSNVFGHGAIDLSQLSQPATQPPPAGTSYVVEIDERNFEAIARSSAQVPVVVEFYSPRAPEQEPLSADLAALANEAGGRYLLGRVNVDTSAQVAAAFQVRAVPTVVGVLGGQVAPLWQGTIAKAEAAAYIEELLRVAAANGVVGRAQPQPVAVTEGAVPSEPAADPRFAAADDALERGDFEAAVAEFDKILAQTPGDPEAVAGKAQASLLVRTGHVDAAQLEASLAAAPDDLDLILQAADLDVAHGRMQAGFERLLQLVRERSGAEKDQARARLVELFETVGNAEPEVIAARRALMSALF